MTEASSTTVTIAYAALDQLRGTRESIGWLTALMKAIRADVEHGKGSNVVALASLGQYVGLDCASLLDDRTADLQQQLDALEAAGGKA